MLDAAARGTFPPADGVVDIFPSPGRCDAIVAFTGHFVIAGDVDTDAVRRRVPPGDFTTPLSAPFLLWLSEQLGKHAGTQDAVLCAMGTGAGAPDWLVARDDVKHPRVERAARYRELTGVWTTVDGQAVVAVGHGLCDRWELGFEIEPDARNQGFGRMLVAAALGLVPAGEPLWAQVAPGNAASLRSMLAAGFVPIGAEVLFARPLPPGRE